jgi:hypothetical protein
MTMLQRMCGMVGIAALFVALPDPVGAQEPRLQGRLQDAVRVEVDALLLQAREAGLPTEPLVDRALEGASKGASGERIVAAVRRLAGELETARDAMGQRARPEELAAGASALRAGAAPEDLSRLRGYRPDQSLTVAVAVLADLVAVGVPVDTAVAAVLVLAGAADDADYIAFRRSVERDVALGASPVAALGVRLDAATAVAEGILDQGAGRTPTAPRKP